MNKTLDQMISEHCGRPITTSECEGNASTAGEQIARQMGANHITIHSKSDRHLFMDVTLSMRNYSYGENETIDDVRREIAERIKDTVLGSFSANNLRHADNPEAVNPEHWAHQHYLNKQKLFATVERIVNGERSIIID